MVFAGYDYATMSRIGRTLIALLSSILALPLGFLLGFYLLFLVDPHLSRWNFAGGRIRSCRDRSRCHFQACDEESAFISKLALWNVSPGKSDYRDTSGNPVYRELSCRLWAVSFFARNQLGGLLVQPRLRSRRYGVAQGANSSGR
jgi:hypothetical protein